LLLPAMIQARGGCREGRSPWRYTPSKLRSEWYSPLFSRSRERTADVAWTRSLQCDRRKRS
jgi:hypothetical protein